MTDALPNDAVDTTNASLVKPAAALFVEYQFDLKATRGKNGDLPFLYVKSIDGKPQEGGKVNVRERGPIRFEGLTDKQKVGLYLHTDACWRKAHVGEVELSGKNVIVKFVETTGKTAHPEKSTVDAKTNTELREVPLDGAMWKTISHLYTKEEAEALLPEEEFSAPVRQAVLAIYAGLSSSPLTVEVAEPKYTLEVRFAGDNNAPQNIEGFDPLRDGLRRAHPWGFAAVIRAAIACELKSVEFFSTWRPLIGSIAHRAGLGHDVSMLGNLVLNRGELLGEASKGCVVAGEDKARETFLAARDAQKATEKALVDAKQGLEDAKKKVELKKKENAVKAAKGKLDAADKQVKADGPEPAEPAAPAPDVSAKPPSAKEKKAQAAAQQKAKARETHKKALATRTEELAAAEKEKASAEQSIAPQVAAVTAAETADKTARTTLADADAAWRKLMESNTNYALVAKFRAALWEGKGVFQIIDPWFIQHSPKAGAKINTLEGDSKDPTEEWAHRNHFHVTIKHPDIPLVGR